MEYSLYYQRQLNESAQQSALFEQQFWNGLNAFMKKPTYAVATKRPVSSNDFCVCLAHYCEVSGPSPICIFPKSRRPQLDAELSGLLEKVFSCQMSFPESDEQFRIVPHTSTRIAYADCECECVFFTLYDLAARGFVRSFVLILFGGERNVLRKRISDTFHSKVNAILRRVTFANLNAFHRDLRAHLSDLQYTLKICSARHSAEQSNGTIMTKRENGDRVTDFLENQKPVEIEKCLREVERIVLYIAACLNAYADRATQSERLDYRADSQLSESGTEWFSGTETETESRADTIRDDSGSDHLDATRWTEAHKIRAPRLVLAGGKPWLSGLVEDSSSDRLHRRSGSESQLSENEPDVTANVCTARYAEDVAAKSTRRRGGPRSYNDLFRDCDDIRLEFDLERIYEALLDACENDCTTPEVRRVKANTDVTDCVGAKSVDEVQCKSVLRISLGCLPLFDVTLKSTASLPILVEPRFNCDMETETCRKRLETGAAKFAWFVSAFSNKTVYALLQCILQGDSVLVCSKSAQFIDYTEAALRAILPRIEDATKLPVQLTDVSLDQFSNSNVPVQMDPKVYSIQFGSSTSSPASSLVSSMRMSSDTSEDDRYVPLFATRLVRDRTELTNSDLRATVILLNKSARKLRCVPHTNNSKTAASASESPAVSSLPICDLDDDDFLPPRIPNYFAIVNNDRQSPQTFGTRLAPAQKSTAQFSVSSWLMHTVTGLKHISASFNFSADKQNSHTDVVCLTLFADAVRSHVLVALQRRIAQLRLDAAHLEAATNGNNSLRTCACATNNGNAEHDDCAVADQIGALLHAKVSANALHAGYERDAFAKTFRIELADSAIVEHFVDRVIDCARHAVHPTGLQSSVNAH